MNRDLLEFLCCPNCKSDLRLVEEDESKPASLHCQHCQLIYRIEDGIPILLAEQAERNSNTPREEE